MRPFQLNTWPNSSRAMRPLSSIRVPRNLNTIKAIFLRPSASPTVSLKNCRASCPGTMICPWFFTAGVLPESSAINPPGGRYSWAIQMSRSLRRVTRPGKRLTVRRRQLLRSKPAARKAQLTLPSLKKSSKKIPRALC